MECINGPKNRDGSTQFLTSLKMLAILYQSFKVESSTIETMTMAKLFSLEYVNDNNAENFHKLFTEAAASVPDVTNKQLFDRFYVQLCDYSEGMKTDINELDLYPEKKT